MEVISQQPPGNPFAKKCVDSKACVSLQARWQLKLDFALGKEAIGLSFHSNSFLPFQIFG